MRTRIMRGSLAAGLALGAIGLCSAPAAAQQVMTVRSTVGGPGGAGVIGKRSLDRYEEILGLSDTQREAAGAIHDAYMASVQQERDKLKTEMDDLRSVGEDAGDRSAFMEKLPEVMRKHQEKMASLEKGFLNDLHALVSEDQEPKWLRVERARRREVGLRGVGVSGAGVDLVEVVRALKLDAGEAKPLADVMDAYEVEIDRALQDRPKGQEALFTPGKPIDLEAMQKNAKLEREFGAKIAGINERSQRQIEALLTDEKRATFAQTIKERTYPRVYRPSRVLRQIDAALGMSEVDEGQKSELRAIRDAYAREVSKANDAWAAAIAEDEKTGDAGGGFVGVGGGVMHFRMGDEPGPVKDARDARKGVDDKYAERLKGLLKPEQLTKAKKAADTKAPEDEGDMPGGAQMEIMVEDSVGH